MAAEEELDLHGGKDKTQTQSVETDAHNQIKSHVPDLSSLIGPGASNEEIVDKLLSIPSSQLIQSEECWLPSKGIYYGWPDGMIRIKAMGTMAEKIISQQRYAQTGQSLDYLFRECCTFPDGFQPEDLLLGDRIFILYYLRGITHGQNYKFVVTCPNCEVVSTHQYNLNELANTITWADPSLGGEPFKVKLPYLSEASKREIWVGVRFLRAADANDMLAKRKARKKMVARPGGGVRSASRGRSGVNQQQQRATTQELDDTITNNMEKIIVSFMGVTDVFKIRTLISSMHSQDNSAIREWLREHTPGIDNTITISCPDCVQEFTIELPITDSFFRPTE